MPWIYFLLKHIPTIHQLHLVTNSSQLLSHVTALLERINHHAQHEDINRCPSIINCCVHLINAIHSFLHFRKFNHHQQQYQWEEKIVQNAALFYTRIGVCLIKIQKKFQKCQWKCNIYFFFETFITLVSFV